MLAKYTVHYSKKQNQKSYLQVYLNFCTLKCYIGSTIVKQIVFCPMAKIKYEVFKYSVERNVV